jgi:hypothetical protein
MENTSTPPKIDKGNGITGMEQCPVFLEWLAWLPEQRRAGRRGRCNDTVKYDKRRGADEEDEEEILS